MRYRGGIAGALLAWGAAIAFPMPAMAYDWAITAKVTAIETSYFPRTIDFKVDQTGGNCMAGALLNWIPANHMSDATTQAQNAQATMTALMAAQLAGRTVTLYGSDSGCEIDFLYIN